jgi:hypothetical protein
MNIAEEVKKWPGCIYMYIIVRNFECSKEALCTASANQCDQTFCDKKSSKWSLIKILFLPDEIIDQNMEI